jgi:hypothetical protein
VAGGGLLLYVAHRLGKLNTVHAFKPKKVIPNNIFLMHHWLTEIDENQILCVD